MSINLNKVIIVGRLTALPETRMTASGQQMATMRLATNRVWVDKSGQKQEKAEFHSIVAWGKLAEICGQYLTKGQEVLFEGRIETRSWEDQAGQKHWRTEIIADNMQMGSRPRDTSGAQPQAQSAPASAPASTSASEQPAPPDKEEISVEEIPF